MAGETFGLESHAVRDLGLRDVEDETIFLAARRESAAVMTKDADFLMLLDRLGPPPQVIWITCGNTTNQQLRQVLADTLPEALRLIESGEPLVEIAG